TIVPEAAVQRGPQGSFVYVVKEDKTAEVRPVKLGVTDGGDASIDSGVAGGELVVVDGADKLRAGTKVDLAKPGGNGQSDKPGVGRADKAGKGHSENASDAHAEKPSE